MKYAGRHKIKSFGRHSTEGNLIPSKYTVKLSNHPVGAIQPACLAIREHRSGMPQIPPCRRESYSRQRIGQYTVQASNHPVGAIQPARLANRDTLPMKPLPYHVGGNLIPNNVSGKQGSGFKLPCRSDSASLAGYSRIVVVVNSYSSSTTGI